MTTGQAEITIRTAREDEHTEVGELTARAYLSDGHVPEGSDYATVLRDAKGRAAAAELLVAVDGTGGPLGTVTLCLPGSEYVELAGPGEVEFRMLAVNPAARGRGIARRLVESVLARARELGFGRVVLCSAEGMTAAHGLYRSMGFRRWPERDWAPMPGVNLLALQVDLDTAPGRAAGHDEGPGPG